MRGLYPSVSHRVPPRGFDRHANRLYVSAYLTAPAPSKHSCLVHLSDGVHIHEWFECQWLWHDCCSADADMNGAATLEIVAHCDPASLQGRRLQLDGVNSTENSAQFVNVFANYDNGDAGVQVPHGEASLRGALT